MKKKENISLDQTSFKIIARTNIDWGIEASINEVDPIDDGDLLPDCDSSVIRVSSRGGSCGIITLDRG